MTSNDAVLRALPKDALLAIARNFASPVIADKTPITVASLVDALAAQASLSIQLIVALSAHMEDDK